MRGVLLLALGSLLLMLPSAAAQFAAPHVTISARYYELLTPEVEVARVPIYVTVSCNGEELLQEPTRVWFRVKEAPSYATVQLNPSKESQMYALQECAAYPSGAKMFRTVATISTTRDAPAYYDGIFTIEAMVEKRSGSTYGPYTTSFSIKNAYVPAIRVEPETLYRRASPQQQVAFPITVANLGNGPTRVAIQVDVNTPPGLSVHPGSELRLESQAGRGPSAHYLRERVIEVGAPDALGVYSFWAHFQARFDGVASDASQDETSVMFTVSVDNEKSYSPEPATAQGTVPSVLAPLIALALAGAAYLRRR